MALYECKTCGWYLTELDVEFANSLKGENVKGQCCECIMGKKQLDLAERSIKKECAISVIRGILPLLTYLLMIPIYFCAIDPPDLLRGAWGPLLVIGSTVVIGILYVFYMLYMQDMWGQDYIRDLPALMYILWALIVDIAVCFRQSIFGSIIISLMSLVWLVISIVTHIICGKDALRISFNKEFDDNDTEPSGYRYETTYKGDGISETPKVNEYSGGDGSGFIIFLFPIWGIVYSMFEPIIRKNKYNKDVKKYCNPELVNLYRRVSRKKNWKVRLGKRELQKVRKAEKEYEESLEAVYAKYNYAGEKVLKQELLKLSFSPPKVTINNEIYYILKMGSKGDLLAYSEGNGKLQIKILYFDYFLYTNKEDWMDTWKDLGNSLEPLQFEIKK